MRFHALPLFPFLATTTKNKRYEKVWNNMKWRRLNTKSIEDLFIRVVVSFVHEIEQLRQSVVELKKPNEN